MYDFRIQCQFSFLVFLLLCTNYKVTHIVNTDTILLCKYLVIFFKTCKNVSFLLISIHIHRRVTYY